MTVFYFTATGNSLYVAKKIGGKLISIPQIMKTGDSAYNDDVIGIVYPCYAGGIPRIVRSFIEKFKLDAKYIFAIMTYGNEHTSALEQMYKFAGENGLRFDYMNYILMIDNYLPMFKMEEQIANSAKKEIENSTFTLVNDIQDRKSGMPDAGFMDKFWGMVFRSGEKKMTGENADMRLTVDKSCTLCGTCPKVCPVNNISVSNAVSFHHQCEGCLACIHHCPSKSIHITGEKSTERFRNENIELAEIIGANE